MKRWLVPLALLSFSLLFLLLALEPLLHEHDEGEEEGCQVCKWLHILESSLAAFFVMAVSLSIALHRTARVRPVSAGGYVFSSIRAPPAS